MRFTKAVLLTATTLLSMKASAYSSGGVYSLATGCTRCHSGGPAVGPTGTVTQVTPSPLFAGGTATLRLVLSSGATNAAERYGAFAASLPTSAGTLVPGSDQPVWCEQQRRLSSCTHGDS